MGIARRSAARHAARIISRPCKIEALRKIEMGDGETSIGAMATHSQIACALSGDEQLCGLVTAAGVSANPGVRRLATLGGNICAHGFAASDLVPALLALDADVEFIRGAREPAELPLADFLTAPDDGPRVLVTPAIIARSARCGAHARLTMRAAGDYPVAIVSAWRSDDGQTLRGAIGAVEAKPGHWVAFEEAVMTGLDGNWFAPCVLKGLPGRSSRVWRAAMRWTPKLMGWMAPASTGVAMRHTAGVDICL